MKNHRINYLTALYQLLEETKDTIDSAIANCDDGVQDTIREGQEEITGRVPGIIEDLAKLQIACKTLSHKKFCESWIE